MADGYSVEFLPSAERELAKLGPAVQRRLGTSIDRLADEPKPRGAKLLVGSAGEHVWRIRVGEYRVLYQIADDRLVVLIIRVGHRREIYRRRRQ
jgi:mRNA interferase RelE/StbE